MMSTVNAVSASINQNLKFRVDQKLTIMMPSFFCHASWIGPVRH